MIAAAYIRRSSATGDNPGDASREAQLAAVQRLCGEDVKVYTDWGISGLKTDRPEYVKLKADIGAGLVSSVCAYSLSRLGRNARELLDFIELCQKHNVPVRTSVESIDTSTAMGRAMLGVMAVFAQLEVEQGMERSAAALTARMDRGDKMGRAKYGYKLVREDGRLIEVRDESIDLARIVQAYREAGSILGACRKLEDDGVPAPMGGTYPEDHPRAGKPRWATSALTRIIENMDPNLLPRKTLTRRRLRASAPLAHLLRCPFCGVMLTPNTARGQYYCRFGAKDRATHPRYAVRERDLMPFLEAEAARYRSPVDSVQAEGTESREAAIADRLDRAHELYMAGDIDRDRYEAEKKRAERDRDDLRGRASAMTLHPEIDWDVPADVVNGALRAIWREVRLDENLRPVEVEWIFPELRA